MTGSDSQDVDLTGLGLLADAARRRLYDFVSQERAPVTRERAAEAAGISRTLAAYHLDKLAEAGLLDISYARPDGRTGPGSGRPAKQYTRAQREVSISFPPRNYSLLAHILADAADTEPIRETLVDAAQHAGHTLGEQAADLPDALTTAGYEPIDTDTGSVLLGNCPFHSIVQQHRELVCALNHAVVRGVLTGVGDDPERAALDPAPGRCCVVIDPTQHTDKNTEQGRSHS